MVMIKDPTAAALLSRDSNALLPSRGASSSVRSLARQLSDGGDLEEPKSTRSGKGEAGIKMAMLACACLLSIGR